MKTFENLIVGDKVYLICIRDSKPYEFPKGRVIRELKADAITRYPSTMCVKLSDCITNIHPKRSMTYYVNYRNEDEIALSADVYALTKAECVKMTNIIINERRTNLRAIERQCKETDAELDNTTAELLMLDVKEEEYTMTEEEFANAALD
jgi:hypothetical protein